MNVSDTLTAVGILAEGIAVVAVGWRLSPGWREPEERTLSDPDEPIAKGEYLGRKSEVLSDMFTEALAAAEAIAQDKEAEAADEIAAL